MENMEKITWRIWESEGFGKALLIGGVLFYIPVINFVLLGFYGCWFRQLLARRGLQLPEWRDGQSIFDELRRTIVPFAVWVLLPLLLAGLLVWAIASLLGLLGLGLFAHTVAWLPLALVALLSPCAFCVSLMRLYRGKGLRHALDIGQVLQQVFHNLKGALFPLFQFYGILLVGWPLLGFAAFLGTMPLLAQLVLVYGHHEEDLKSTEY